MSCVIILPGCQGIDFGAYTENGLLVWILYPIVEVSCAKMRLNRRNERPELTNLVISLALRPFLLVSEILFQYSGSQTCPIGNSKLILHEAKPAVRPCGWNGDKQPSNDVGEEFGPICSD